MLAVLVVILKDLDICHKFERWAEKEVGRARVRVRPACVRGGSGMYVFESFP